MVLFLIGYMGCGKSTIGRTIAKRLGVVFADMDKSIEESCAMSISEIFAARGESGFRAMEREFLLNIATTKDDMVIATGGGTPCKEDNIEVMNRIGDTVYFKMSPPRLLKRLGRGRERRPLIKDMNDEQLLAFIECNITARAPFYEKAKLIIDCDGVSDEYIARHIECYAELIRQKR